jgi:hypothetical protein
VYIVEGGSGLLAALVVGFLARWSPTWSLDQIRRVLVSLVVIVLLMAGQRETGTSFNKVPPRCSGVWWWRPLLQPAVVAGKEEMAASARLNPTAWWL